jgi:hypothetical protein
MATPYRMPTWMSQTLGLQPRPFIFPDAPAPTAMAPAPMAAPAQQPAYSNPNRDMLRAVMQLTGGQNMVPDEAAARRQTALALQDEVRRQAQWQSAYDAVQAGKAMQAQQAAEQQRLNGVNNGVAYRNGQPVGFAGAVPGVRPGIPQGGFNPAEQQAFNRQLMAMVNPMPAATPQQMVANAPAPVAAPMPGAAFQRSEAFMPRTTQGLPDDTPESASRAARTARGLTFGGLSRPETGGGMPLTRPVVPDRQNLNIAQAANQEANITRGLAARDQIKTLEKSLPSLLPQIAELVGAAVDEDALANQILAEEEWNKTQEGQPPYISELPVINFFLPLGIDPKVALRWAQDRKKARS